MDILVTGRLSSLSGEALRDLAAAHKVVCVAEDLKTGQFGSDIEVFPISVKDPDFERVIRSYNFNTALYFSDILYQKDLAYSEVAALECCLNLCVYNEIGRVIFFHPSIDPSRKKGKRSVLLDSCLNLCDFYNRNMRIELVTAALPNLYGWGEAGSIPGRILSAARTRKKVILSGSEDQDCAFLAAEDLSCLLLRLCENWPGKGAHLEIPPADVLSLGELVDMVKEYYPKLRVGYEPAEELENTKFASAVTKETYGWVPMHHLEAELPHLVDKRKEAASRELRQSLGDRFYNFAEKHPIVIRSLELILGFLLMEFLIRITDTTAQFRYIDFRLLFVLMMGILHGIGTGLSAALFASASLVYAMAAEHSAWYAVAHDIDAWLPLLFLFLMGAVAGYIKNRYLVENKALAEDKSKLEEKYVLLSEFYVNALNNKDQFKQQIVSYRDSFGRLFDISKDLNSTLVEEVCAEAVHALESLLENDSICIYKVGGNATYGRLVASSKDMRAIADKKLDLTALPALREHLEDAEVWANRSRLEKYPEYAYPIYVGDMLMVLILVGRADYSQMSVYFENLVKIGCGMVKIALLRAMEYTQHTYSERYLDDTCVQNTEHFARLLEAKEKMTRRGIAEYSLFRLDIPMDKLPEYSAQIARRIHSTDTLGIGRDGNVYLCLSQTNPEDAEQVLARIWTLGITPVKCSMEDAV